MLAALWLQAAQAAGITPLHTPPPPTPAQLAHFAWVDQRMQAKIAAAYAYNHSDRKASKRAYKARKALDAPRMRAPKRTAAAAALPSPSPPPAAAAPEAQPLQQSPLPPNSTAPPPASSVAAQIEPGAVLRSAGQQSPIEPAPPAPLPLQPPRKLHAGLRSRILAARAAQPVAATAAPLPPGGQHLRLAAFTELWHRDHKNYNARRHAPQVYARLTDSRFGHGIGLSDPLQPLGRCEASPGGAPCAHAAFHWAHRPMHTRKGEARRQVGHAIESTDARCIYELECCLHLCLSCHSLADSGQLALPSCASLNCRVCNGELKWPYPR